MDKFSIREYYSGTLDARTGLGYGAVPDKIQPSQIIKIGARGNGYPYDMSAPEYTQELDSTLQNPYDLKDYPEIEDYSDFLKDFTAAMDDEDRTPELNDPISRDKRSLGTAGLSEYGPSLNHPMTVNGGDLGSTSDKSAYGGSRSSKPGRDKFGGDTKGWSRADATSNVGQWFDPVEPMFPSDLTGQTIDDVDQEVVDKDKNRQRLLQQSMDYHRKKMLNF